MLNPTNVKIFAFLSILLHVTFALLFARVSPSFPPPPIKELSLSLFTRGGGQSKVIQSGAAWPMPRRSEPGFSASEILKSLEAEGQEWTQYGLPDTSFFSPADTLMPHPETAELAAEAFAAPPEELFSQLPAQSKSMPMDEFALGPIIPEMFEDN